VFDSPSLVPSDGLSTAKAVGAFVREVKQEGRMTPGGTSVCLFSRGLTKLSQAGPSGSGTVQGACFPFPFPRVPIGGERETETAGDSKGSFDLSL
jgi:hypothetical protein